MKNNIRKLKKIFLLTTFLFTNQTILGSVPKNDIVSGATAQINYLLNTNNENLAKGSVSENWYVYFLGGNLEDIEFVLNKRKDSDFSSNYLYKLNEALKKVNKNRTAVYVAFTAYNEELITPIFPDDLSSLSSMEDYLRSDVLTADYNISEEKKEIALKSFQKYAAKFNTTYQEILQEVYDKSNFKTTDFDNIIIPFTNYSSRQIIQQDGDYLDKKYDMYSLYLPKINANFNYENYQKTYRETDVFAPQYGLQRIEQKIERIVLSLDIYFNQGGSTAKPCESLLYDPKLQDVIKELKQDEAWRLMIEEDPCILNTIYPNLNLYSDSAQFEKDLALFVCAPLYAAMAVPAGAIIGEAAFVELAKYLIKKHGADKIKNVSQAIAANIIMQTGYNYYFGEDYITNTKDTSERWLLALKAIDKGDLGKDVLVAAYELDYRSELVLTCLNDGLQIDINNLNDTKFNINECLSSVTRDILLKMFFDTSSATIKSALKRIKADPAIFKKGFREMLVDAGQDGRKALSESLEEIKKAFEPKGPLIRIVNVEAKYGFEADNTANVEPSGTNKIEFSNKVKNVLLELEKQIDEGTTDITALGTNVQLNIEGLESIKSTILAETANGYKVIFLETGGKTINTLSDYIATTTNRIKFLDAIKNGSINKATMVGDNANAYFGKPNVEIDINSIEIYNVDSNGSITGNKNFKVSGAGSLAQYVGKSTKGIKNILPLENPTGLFRQLKGTNGQTYRAATFWTDEGADIIHYISQDAKYYIKHDPTNGRVLFIDAENNKFMGFMLDQDNIVGANYNTLVENLKTIHGLPNSVRTVNIKGTTITFADDKANLVLGKYKPNNSPGISGEIGTDDVIDQMTILKNYSFADKSFELRKGSVHVLNIPDGNVTQWTTFFEDYNKQFLDLVTQNPNSFRTILVSDPRKAQLLRAALVDGKYVSSGFAKEIKYLRDRGIKNVTLKDGTNLNLDDIDLSNLNWAGWQY